jgi:hypothetical protein
MKYQAAMLSLVLAICTSAAIGDNNLIPPRREVGNHVDALFIGNGGDGETGEWL